jgi:hypothetical protein
MKMSQYAATAFIKLEDVSAGPLCKLIASIDEGQFGKPVITFSDGTKFSLNKTNTRALIRAFGTEDHEAWLDREIVLYAGKVKISGEPTDLVLAKLPDDEKPASTPDSDMNDSIPF